MLYAVLLLGLAAAVSSLPPGGAPRGSPLSASAAPRPGPRVDHRLDLLALSRRLSAAVTPLLEVFLTPIIESLPEDYMERLAESIKRGAPTGDGIVADPILHQVRYFEDEDKLQLHEDYKSNVINKEA